MAILKSNLLFNRNKSAEATTATQELQVSPAADIEAPAPQQTADAEDEKPDIQDVPSKDVQSGVAKIQAVTLTWSRASMLSILCLYVIPARHLKTRLQD
jgi:hypothetical protein